MSLTKKRVYEIARDLEVPTKDLLEALVELGMPGLRAVNTVTDEEAEIIREFFRERPAAPVEGAPPAPTAPPKPEKPRGVARPPVVAVLGHIDHGKTTLLDAIRKAHVAEGEAGGITQSIGAYQASVHGRAITFIDTPGHRAFTAMRARGAQITDIAVLVVAADDGVMAQTLEAIDHIKAAGVPMVVAINKMDKPGANRDKILQELAKLGYTPEEWGGTTVMVSLSALTGQGVEELLEMILLLADLEGIYGDPDAEIEAMVIESHLDPGRGPLATVVVKNGSLRERDALLVGPTWGRVRALLDHQGERVATASPGMPVLVLGLSDVPQAGERVERIENANDARRIAEERARSVADKRRVARPPMTFEELIQAAQAKKLVVVLKAASTGALDAAKHELGTLKTDGVELEILHVGVGPVTESDVLLASAEQDMQPLIVGFAVRVDGKAQRLAEQRSVPVRTYDIIYDLTQDVGRALRRLLGPELRETKVGEVEVLQTFDIDGVGRIAGCSVRSGRVVRGARVKAFRNGEETFSGEIASLKRFTDDVREVQAGRECGIRVRDWNDVLPGDTFEIYTVEEIPV
ncbi:TPA: translation initiation factor IF-2 [Candidatus Acetothermia bacterium]|nr:translation initiation factor IF-2 [Candidatus Acetothermia bacterium]HAZ30000.1 translation initiation factor IF-2 [Candidatus Acetothermia bacterium]